MAHGPRYHVPFRRRREGKTDFRARLALLRSGKTRAVLRRSLSGMNVQLIDAAENGDRVLVQAGYKDLEKLGWKHSVKDTTASYLVGLLAGKKAGQSGIEEAVLDIGLHEPGMDIPHGEEMFPDDDRLAGKHKEIDGFAKDFEAMKKKILEM